MYAVVVTLDLKPGTQDSFMRHMQANAGASVRDEPGCQRFDVCTDPSRPDHLFLYELYDDLAAFEAHQQMPHYIKMNADAGDMIVGKSINTYEAVWP